MQDARYAVTGRVRDEEQHAGDDDERIIGTGGDEDDERCDGRDDDREGVGERPS